MRGGTGRERRAADKLMAGDWLLAIGRWLLAKSQKLMAQSPLPFVMPRKTAVEHSKGIFEVEWPLFGELSRALALRVARDYDPEMVIGIAPAGVVPAATIALPWDREVLIDGELVPNPLYADALKAAR